MPNVNTEEVQEALGALGDLPGKLTWWNLLYAAGLVLVCMLVSKIVLSMTNRLMKRSRLDKSLHTFVQSILRILLVFLSTLVVLDALGVKVTSLVALFSVIALALSLAAQGVLSNVAGGLVVLWSKPFQVGDFVEVDSITGTVKDVTLMYTQIDTTDNRLVYLTNKAVAEAKLVNYSAEETRRVEFTIEASYDSPVEAVKAAINQVIGEHPKTLPTPTPIVRVGNYGSSAIQYHVRCWCASQDYWDVYYDLLEGVKAAFDQRGLEMTYNHVNVHMIPDKRDGGRK